MTKNKQFEHTGRDLGARHPNLSQADRERLQNEFGADNLTMDDHGNICDRHTGQVIHRYKSKEEVRVEEHAACRDYFRGLPVAVQKELLKAALAHSVQGAMERMNMYTPSLSKEELWGISYEELAKLAAEGILLHED